MIDWTKHSLEEVARVESEPESRNVLQRQFEMQRRATAAQISAARYMLLSVIAITITSGLNALFAFLMWYAPHLPH
jgi:hypothetical protein